ncbi:MAG: threonine ammonia-lyase [Betaproteobacteria bacterium]|nr:threonine ammonia-lyase [Betaproteobacteria bacterium]
MINLDSILAAQKVLRGHIVNTPCPHSRTLSEITGAEVFLKFENHQFTASFKERGALNKLVSLDAAQRAKGVIAASAGNHAQGVAHHATRLGIPSVIVMPRHTPNVKVEMTRKHGAEVVLHGDTFDEAKAMALQMATDRSLTFVHPYDDERVIAGQGTIALEMLEAHPDLDCLCIAIGGGGLIAGMATAARAIKPAIDIVGVETTRFPSMYAALRGVPAQFGASTIAEGIAVKEPGALTRAIVEKLVSEILLVDEGEIEEAIVLLLEIEKTVVEGAGAASLAALMKHRARFAGKKVGLVLCGGNIDPLTLAEIIQRGMVRSGRLSRLRVELRDLPGALARITTVIGEANANIEEVHHQRAFTNLPVQSAEVDFVLKTRDAAHVAEIIGKLAEAGFKASASHTSG